MILAASSKAACEAKSNPQRTYKWAAPFDATDELATVEEECLVLPPPIQCQQAPFSRYLLSFVDYMVEHCVVVVTVVHEYTFTLTAWPRVVFFS